MPNLLVVNGHPDKESFCAALANAHADGSREAGVAPTILHLADLKFNPVLTSGYRKRTELEPDLVRAQQLIAAADHLVFVYPIWWAAAPALLKGFFDRAFLPGFAYRPRENSALHDKLLTGKTARLIVTMDAPVWYDLLVYRHAGIVSVKVGTLEYCGIKPVRVTTFGQVKFSTEIKRRKWLATVRALGRAGA